MAETLIRVDPVPIRLATPDDVPSVLNVVDGGGLQTSYDEIRRAADRGEVLVATGPSSGTVLGAIVLEGAEIRALAVRPGRRGQGIGTALVEAGADTRQRRLDESGIETRRGPVTEQQGAALETPVATETLVATFHESVTPFWQSLDFEIEQIDGTDRSRGVRYLDVGN